MARWAHESRATYQVERISPDDSENEDADDLPEIAKAYKALREKYPEPGVKW